MLEPDNPADGAAPTPTPAPTDQEIRPRRRTKKAAPPPPEPEAVTPTDDAPAKAPRRRRSAARPAADAIVAEGSAADPAGEPDAAPARPTRRRAAKKVAAEAGAVPQSPPATSPTPAAEIADAVAAETAAMVAPTVTFVAPSTASEPAPRRRRRAAAATGPVTEELAHAATEAEQPAAVEADAAIEEPEEVRELAAEEATGARRRRRRGRRGRGRRDADEITEVAEGPDSPASDEASATDDTGSDQEAETTEGETTSASRRRRRRRRRDAESADETAAESGDDPADTVVHVREGRTREAPPQNGDGVRGVRGSTRLEAKRQRRQEGRDSGRRRAPILTEAEFLARREAVDRTMAVRELGDRTQIAVLEDGVLVEHYVTRASATSYVGNVYLGRVQNVLPSMEAAFVDIGKGRNGVLYAGEVNWDISGLEGKARAIENALKSGDTVLVQVTKDPVGHKGARLTSQISLPGRFLVYVPRGGMTGISRKLPDTERHRLKSILKKVVPEDAGVIIRTAAEGATEEELTRDVERLTAQWNAIQEKARQPKSAPTLVYGEPDLAIRVVRDVFNEDFDRLIVEGEQEWATVSNYVAEVAPDLRDRASRHTGESDLFHELRVDEQLSKALSRKVFLPSGGSLVIDRTEAMTVIDVNTGKFIGAGGNLEQTVTRNNIEAAEEIVRQLRLRDIGGIIVIDFIDMVLESNRDLVLRRLIECLGRDRTKHQVAEVTSLGLVQMTRKRVGEGLLEAFSEPCPTCGGRGLLIHDEPVDQRREEASADDRPAAKRSRRKRGEAASEAAEPAMTTQQRKTAATAMAAIAGMRSGSDSDQPEPAVPAAADEPSEAHASGAAEHRAEVAEVAEVDGSRPVPAEPPSDPESEVDVETKPPADGESAEPSRAPGDRRRRSASRPAGPPVPVG
jgi:ribonuclease E